MEVILAITSHIKCLREAAGMSQKEVAEKLHLAEENYGKFERGAGKLDLKRLLAISAALGTDMENILQPLLKSPKTGCPGSENAAAFSRDPISGYAYDRVIRQMLSIAGKQAFIIRELDHLSAMMPAKGQRSDKP